MGWGLAAVRWSSGGCGWVPKGCKEEVAGAQGVGLGLGVASRCMTWYWSAGVLVGQLGRPGVGRGWGSGVRWWCVSVWGVPLGSPVLAKLVQYCPIWSESLRSSGRTSSGTGVEGAEDVLDVVGVEGAHGCGVVLVAGVAECEEVAIDGRVAGLGLRLDPAPGGEGDEAVADEIAGGREGLGVGGGGVEGEEVVGAVAKVFVGLGGEAFGGDGGGEEDGGANFVGVPSGEEGNVGLLAGGVDVGTDSGRK